MPTFAKLLPVTITPTTEQQQALDAFATGENLLIRAGAGTGKTSTLRLLGESAPERDMLFIAFNSSVKTDAAASFPANVTCLTSHGLANRALRSSNPRLMRKMSGPRQSPVDISKILNIPYQGFSYGNLGLVGWQCASIVMSTVRRFTYSADTEINFRHVERIENASDDEQAQLEAFIRPFARKAWADLTSESGRLSWGKSHDYYLKFWALTNPVLDFDAVFVDEAQDTNPCLAGIIANQRCQIVMVGDESQAIYGWRGARDAMSAFDAPHVVTLSQSFRFGQAVADEANKFLSVLDAPLRLTGFAKIDSRCRRSASPTRSSAAPTPPSSSTRWPLWARARRSPSSAARPRSSPSPTPLPSSWRASASRTAIWPPSSPGARFRSTPGQGGRGPASVMVRLIDTYGVPAILDVCDASTAREADADLIVSTAHKAKGREWNQVKIANDFKVPEEGAEPSRSELMLMYVAVTRAKLALDCLALSWINAYASQEA
jgi:hypothetical protein